MATLKIATRKKEDTPTEIDVIGALDAETVGDLESLFGELFDDGHSRIILCLDRLRTLSGVGVRTLLEAAETARDQDGHLILVRPSDSVMELLDLLGLKRFFQIADSVAEACDRFDAL